MFKIIVFILLNISLIAQISFADLSSQELEEIDRYVQQVSIEDSVGQLLMVGVPADIYNYSNNDDLRKIITEFGVGGVFVNSYNYYQKKTDDTSDLYPIEQFNSRLQDLAEKSSIRLPLLIGADFENYKFNSLPSDTISPPSALTLGSTQDGELLRSVGRAVASDLRGIGINVIMGPVLDVDRTSQGKYSVLTNRMFASSPERVHGFAEHYLCGLKEGGISVIGKHFPGLGAVQKNPHITIPRFEASFQNFKSQVSIYPSLAGLLDGVMTAHVDLAFFEPEKQKPATFSSRLVTDLLRGTHTVYLGKEKIEGFGLADLVCITDDLSDMGSVIEYMDKHEKDYAQVAIDAFDAGHDLLLFSHIEVSDEYKRGKHGRFWIKDLNKVLGALTTHIQSSDLIETKFRKSLRRILLLKQKIYKTINGDRDGLMIFDGGSLKTSLGNSRKYEYGGQQFDTIDELIKKSIDKSVTAINTRISINISEYTPETKICFYIDAKGYKQFERVFSSKFPNSSFHVLPSFSKKDDFAKLKLEVENNLTESDLMVITVMSVDNANLVEHLRLNKYKDVTEKLIILMHDTPKLLSSEMLTAATIVGTFTRHPQSYLTDIEVLSGLITPNKISFLPVNLGVNDNFHAIIDYAFSMAPPDGFAKIQYFSTQREEDLFNKNIDLTTRLNEASTRLSTYHLALIGLIFCYLLFKVVKFMFELHSKLRDDSDYTFNFRLLNPAECIIDTIRAAPVLSVKIIVILITLIAFILLLLDFNYPLIFADLLNFFLRKFEWITSYRN